MAIATAVSDSAPAARSWLERWSPIAGIVFVASGVALAFTPAGDGAGESPAEVVAFADDNQGWLELSLLFALLSLLLLGWFVSGLFTFVRELGHRIEAVLVVVGGLLLTLLFFMAITIWSATLVDLGEDETTKLDHASTYLAIDDVGWVALGGAGVGAGLMAIAASLAALRAAAVPAWAAWLGVALGIASLATIAFFGLFAWLAWIVLASIVLLRAERRPT
jgi:hypothetical protein